MHWAAKLRQCNGDATGDFKLYSCVQSVIMVLKLIPVPNLPCPIFAVCDK
jgi:hypothetical protein